MVHTQSPPTSTYQDSSVGPSCRFNNPYQQLPAMPTYFPQMSMIDFNNLGNQALDFSQGSQQNHERPSPAEMYQNAYFPSPAHSMPASMYQYRYNPYNPYQMYDFGAYTQTLQQLSAATSSPAQHHTSPAASISPVSSIGSNSPPAEQQYPTANFDWLRPINTCKAKAPGKTRTKDKYRVVYSDFQRLELEKEFCYNKFITLRRKAEIAAALNLSERQVKIWFQNRRAKERRQKKEYQTVFDTDAPVPQTQPDTNNTSAELAQLLSTSGDQSPVAAAASGSSSFDSSSNLLTSAIPWKDFSGSDSDGPPSFTV